MVIEPSLPVPSPLDITISPAVSSGAEINGNYAVTNSTPVASSKVVKNSPWKSLKKPSRKSPNFPPRSSPGRPPLEEGAAAEKSKKSLPLDGVLPEKQELDSPEQTNCDQNSPHAQQTEQGHIVTSEGMPEKVKDQEVKGPEALLEKDLQFSAEEDSQEKCSPEKASKRKGSSPIPLTQGLEKLHCRKSRFGLTQSIPASGSFSEGGSDEESLDSGPKLISVSTLEAYLKNETGSKSPHLGSYLLKLAKSYALGENFAKAIEYGNQAVKFYEKQSNGKPCLDLVVSLHIVAALNCRLEKFEEAIPLLERSVAIPDLSEGEEHALAKFAGHMQLGDTLNLLGRQEAALQSYHAALQVQKETLGELDPRVGETCHYIAEAHLQAMEFQEAEVLCEHALAIHKEHSEAGSLEEAADGRLLALIYSAKGDHENALENLVHANATLLANDMQIDVAAINSSIGDALLALGRDGEAVLSYQKALTVFKALKGDNHTLVASTYISLAELYLRTNKLREAKTYCESALCIYGKQGAGHAPAPSPEDVANGLTDIAAIFEQLNEKETALLLLQRALKIQDNIPGQQFAVGGIEAQMGILYNMMEKFMPALDAFKSASIKLKGGGVKKTALLGILLNQMGITCVELGEIKQASQLFEESKSVLEDTCGPHHPDTLDVCTNLASTYDALGRLEDAIKLLEEIVQVKEEKLGTVHPDIHDDRKRLQELLKDVGRSRTHKSRKLEELLLNARKENSKSK